MGDQGIVVRFPTGLRDILSSTQLGNRPYSPPDFYAACTGGWGCSQGMKLPGVKLTTSSTNAEVNGADIDPLCYTSS
jgi:hypothetical protein